MDSSFDFAIQAADWLHGRTRGYEIFLCKPIDIQDEWSRWASFTRTTETEGGRGPAVHYTL